jgi:predicted MFS family arabinose efflux permease
MTRLIAANQLTTLAGPVLGPVADRAGPKIMMIAALGLLAAGGLVAGLAPMYATICAALVLTGLGKAAFDPALQSYVGARVPYARRGRAMGLVELAWAGSALLGIPLAGLLMTSGGWSAPFLALGALALVAVALLTVVLPRTARPPATAGPSWATWEALARSRPARGMVGYAFCFAAANDTLFAVYGAWLQRDLGVSLTTVGLATTVIGAADFAGETLSAGAGDRLRLTRAVRIGCALTAAAYLLLLIPAASRALPLALACLFLIFTAFEFTIVVGLSVASEIAPTARATLASSLMAASSLGRATGTLLAVPVRELGGAAGTGLVSAAISVLALALLCWGLHGWRLGRGTLPA